MLINNKFWRGLAKRLIAGFLLVSFEMSTLVSFPTQGRAQTVSGGFESQNPQSSKEHSILSGPSGHFNLPPSLGTVEATFAGKSNKAVILIQDAHAVPGAQKSIRSLVGYLEKKIGVRTIAVEGTSGRIDTTLLKTFPDPKIVRRLMEGYLERGELSGAFAAATSPDSHADYRGVEDPKLYEEGISLFLKASGKQAEILSEMTALEKEMEELKAKIYSPELLVADRLLKTAEEANAEWSSVLAKLAKRPENAAPNFNERFPRLAAIFGEVNRSAAPLPGLEKMAAEIRAEIRDKKILPQFQGLLQGYRTERISPEAFAYELLEMIRKQNLPAGVGEETSRQNEVGQAPLHQMARHYAFLKKMKGSEYLREFEEYRQRLMTGLARNSEEKTLREGSDQIRLLGKWVKLELSRGEWARVKAMTSTGERKSAVENRQEIAALNRKIRNVIEIYRQSAPEFWAFYSNAEKREAAILTRLTEALQKNSPTILVAGGFHAEGLAAALKEKGISVVLISPAIPELPKENYYSEYMHGQVSWKSYFEERGGKIDLADAFNRAMRDQLLQEDKTVLKPWRDQIIRTLNAEGRVAVAGNYTRYLDQTMPQGVKRGLAPSDLREAWFDRVDRFIVGLRHLQTNRQLTAESALRLAAATAQFWAAVPSGDFAKNIPAWWAGSVKVEGRGTRTDGRRKREDENRRGGAPVQAKLFLESGNDKNFKKIREQAEAKSELRTAFFGELTLTVPLLVGVAAASAFLTWGVAATYQTWYQLAVRKDNEEMIARMRKALARELSEAEKADNDKVKQRQSLQDYVDHAETIAEDHHAENQKSYRRTVPLFMGVIGFLSALILWFAVETSKNFRPTDTKTPSEIQGDTPLVPAGSTNRVAVPDRLTRSELQRGGQSLARKVEPQERVRSELPLFRAEIRTARDSASQPRSELRQEPWKEKLLEGIGEQFPDWQRMNVVGQIILDRQQSRPGAVKLEEITAPIDQKLKAQGIYHPDIQSYQYLIDRLVWLELLKKDEGGGYQLAVESYSFAIKTNHIRYILQDLNAALGLLERGVKGAEMPLRAVIEAYAKATEEWPLYPSESQYPVTHAVSLLSPERQKRLSEFLETIPIDPTSPALIDNLLHMLKRDAHLKDFPEGWLRRVAPNLVGRTIYYISPETWLAAGGLGRVGQNHTIRTKGLLGDAADLVTIEPYYPFRIVRNADGSEQTVKDVDYTKLPVPVEDLKEVPELEFQILVRKGNGRKTVTVQVFKGRNKYGIEVYLVKDKPETEGGEEYYTRALYRYGGNGATWPEFTEFLSKASLKLGKLLEYQKMQKATPGTYRSPVFWGNDGQTASMPLFKRISDRAETLTAEERQEMVQNPKSKYWDLLLDPYWGEPQENPDEERLKLRQAAHDALLDLIQDSTREAPLSGALVHQTCHTVWNRNGHGSSTEDFVYWMGIPRKWWPYSQRDGQYDATSSGMRAADSTNGVSAMHQQVIAPYDPNVRVLAITNGDHLEASSSIFREIFQSPEFQARFPRADPENPTPEQIIEEDRMAVNRVRTDETLLKLDPEFSELNPDAPTFIYFGRLVWEKAGRQDPESGRGGRAFSDENIIKLVKAGADVIMMGNIQGHWASAEMYRRLKELQARIKREGIGPGHLVVASGWGIPEQRKVLALVRGQVNDSEPGTEAAGFTETNAAATGGVEVTLPVPEGIYNQQGEIAELGSGGIGNTFIADALTSEAYWRVFERLIKKHNSDRLGFAAHQVTSVRLSRALDARLTGANYLREFSKAVERKENPVEALKHYASGDEGVGQFFRGEWLRADLTRALKAQAAAKSGTEILDAPNNPAIAAFVTSGISARNDLNIVMVEQGVRSMTGSDGHGVLQFKDPKKFKNIFTRLRIPKNGRVQIMDPVTGTSYGNFSLSDLTERGLYVEVPEGTNVQVLRVTHMVETLEDARVTRASLFYSPSANAATRMALLSLLPGKLLQHAENVHGAKPENFVFWTPADQFFPAEKAPKQWTDAGYYLLTHKGGGHISVTITPTLKGMWDTTSLEGEIELGQAYGYLSLEADGNRLKIGYGAMQDFLGMNGEAPRRGDALFNHWYTNQLKPFAERFGFETVTVRQVKLTAPTLEALGFRLVSEKTATEPAVWEARITDENREAEDRMLEALGTSLEVLPKIFPSKTTGQESEKGFVWRLNDQEPAVESRPWLTGFIDGFYRLYTKNRAEDVDGSIRYHALRGDAFIYLLASLEGVLPAGHPFREKIEALAAQTQATGDPGAKERLLREAIRLVDRFVAKLDLHGTAEKLFDDYLRTEDSAEVERLSGFFANPELRKLVADVLERNPAVQRLGTTDDNVRAYAVPYQGSTRLVLLDLGAKPIALSPDRGERKGPELRGEILGDESMRKIFGDEAFNDPYSNFQILDSKILTADGKKKTYGLFPMFLLKKSGNRSGLPFGIPAKEGIQILEFRPGSGRLVSYLSAVLRNEYLEGEVPPRDLLTRGVEEIRAAHPEDNLTEVLKRDLADLLALPRHRAWYLFEAEGVPAAITFIAALAPELLPEMEKWNPATVQALQQVIGNHRELFSNGAIRFHGTNNHSALLISRSVGDDHLFTEIQFSPGHPAPDGKVRSLPRDIDLLEWDPEGLYVPHDEIVDVDYRPGNPYLGEDLKKNAANLDPEKAFHVGIPVTKIAEGYKRIQIIWMKKNGRRSEVLPKTEAIDTGRSELRGTGRTPVPAAGLFLSEKSELPPRVDAGTASGVGRVGLRSELRAKILPAQETTLHLIAAKQAVERVERMMRREENFGKGTADNAIRLELNLANQSMQPSKLEVGNYREALVHLRAFWGKIDGRRELPAALRPEITQAQRLLAALDFSLLMEDTEWLFQSSVGGRRFMTALPQEQNLIWMQFERLKSFGGNSAAAKDQSRHLLRTLAREVLANADWDRLKKEEKDFFEDLSLRLLFLVVGDQILMRPVLNIREVVFQAAWGISAASVALPVKGPDQLQARPETKRAELRQQVLPAVKALAANRMTEIKPFEQLAFAIHRNGIELMGAAIAEAAEEIQPQEVSDPGPDTIGADMVDFLAAHPDYSEQLQKVIEAQLAVSARQARTFLDKNPNRQLHFAFAFPLMSAQPILQQQLEAYISMIASLKSDPRYAARIFSDIRILVGEADLESGFLQKIEHTGLAKRLEWKDAAAAGMVLDQYLKDHPNALIYGISEDLRGVISRGTQNRVVSSDLLPEGIFPVTVRLSDWLARVSEISPAELLQKAPELLPGVVESRGNTLTITARALDLVYRDYQATLQTSASA